jgi:hypothetical protein
VEERAALRRQDCPLHLLLLLGLLLGALGFVRRFDRGGVGVGELLAAFAVESGADADVDREALAA